MASAADEQFWHDNIVNTFKDFGYTPTQAEIDALIPASEGTGGFEAGQAAVANYVMAHQQLTGAQSLIQGNLQAELTGSTTAQNLGGTYSNQAQTTAGQGISSYQKGINTLQQAPMLFGNLTPDQVSTYLAPLQTQFNYGLGQVQGASAARGLTGSSLEAQAMAQAQQQYQQNVLSQALQLGLNNQSLVANAYASLGSGQLGLANTQYGMAQQQYGLAPQYLGLANQSAGQNTQIAEDLAQLPGQSASQAIAQNAALQALNPPSSNGWTGALGMGLGALAGGVAGSFMGNPLLGASLGSSLGGSAASAITGNSSGANMGALASNPLLLASLYRSNTSGGGGGGASYMPWGNGGYTSGLQATPGPVLGGTPNYGQAGSTLLPPSLSLTGQ